MRLPHWLSPGISRREVAESLAGQPAGTFLVRASKTHPGCFAISVAQPSGRLQSYLIVRKSQGWRLGNEGRVHFPSIAALVRYFATIPITASASAGGELCTLRLDRPVAISSPRPIACTLSEASPASATAATNGLVAATAPGNRAATEAAAPPVFAEPLATAAAAAVGVARGQLDSRA